MTVEQLGFLCANQYTVMDFYTMELKILQPVKWNITFPLPGDITRFLVSTYVANVDGKIFEEIDELIIYALTSNFNDLINL